MPTFPRSLLDDPGKVLIPKNHYKCASEPLEVGDSVIVRTTIARNELECPAAILDTREAVNEDGSVEIQYYVHYEERDRRNDEWIDKSRILEFVPPLNAPVFTTPRLSTDSLPLTRSMRRMQEEFSHKQRSYDDMDATTAKLEKQHEELTKIKNVQRAIVGAWDMDVWYYSPYRKDIIKPDTEAIYICEYCLQYFISILPYKNHVTSVCQWRKPPGNEIYRHDNLAVFEVFGCVYKTYCQSLCLLSKLFLDHKTLYYEVENFRFYVLCEVDSEGAHIVGHFSKEYGTDNNLACIMVLPPFQRRGYGKLLIQLSYALSRRESRIGTPEKPLSDLGKVSYRSYWWWILIRVLDESNIDRNISVIELSEMSGIHPDDITSTFNAVQMVKYYKLSKEYMIRCSKSIINCCKTLPMFKPPKIILNERNLRWSVDAVFVPNVLKREPSVLNSEPGDVESVDDGIYDSDSRSISTRDS